MTPEQITQMLVAAINNAVPIVGTQLVTSATTGSVNLFGNLLKQVQAKFKDKPVEPVLSSLVNDPNNQDTQAKLTETLSESFSDEQLRQLQELLLPLQDQVNKMYYSSSEMNQTFGVQVSGNSSGHTFNVSYPQPSDSVKKKRFSRYYSILQ